MFHSNTERLIDYWRMRKVERLSPLRSAIDPSDFTDLLPQIFILGRAAPGQFLFRLAGGLVSDLHQRDLRRNDLLSVWAHADRPRLSAALEAARRAAEPIVLTAEGRTAEGLTAKIEILMAPLRADGVPQDRFLGLYQSLSPLVLLQGKPIEELGLIRFASAEDRIQPNLRLVVNDGQRIA